MHIEFMYLVLIRMLGALPSYPLYVFMALCLSTVMTLRYLSQSKTKLFYHKKNKAREKCSNSEITSNVFGEEGIPLKALLYCLLFLLFFLALTDVELSDRHFPINI